jgi:hypothetical protein
MAIGLHASQAQSPPPRSSLSPSPGPTRDHERLAVTDVAGTPTGVDDIVRESPGSWRGLSPDNPMEEDLLGFDDAVSS